MNIKNCWIVIYERKIILKDFKTLKKLVLFQEEVSGKYCIWWNFRPFLFSPLSPSLSASELKLDEFRCFQLFPFKHTCLGEFKTKRNCFQV